MTSMKKKCKCIYFGVFRIVYWLFPYCSLKKIKKTCQIWYSFWLKHAFAQCGSQVMFYGVELLEGEKFMQIGDNTSFGMGLYLTAWKIDAIPNLRIGKNCSFGAYNHLSCANCITIDDGVLTGKFVSIIDNAHGNTTYDDLITPPTLRPCVSKGSIYICRNVWIGDKVTILPGVTIGEGTVVGANSVVSQNIPPYSVAVGIPAKVVKSLNPHS